MTAAKTGVDISRMMQPMLGEPAPLFDLKDTKGNTFSLTEQRGKFVVIHFGATW